MRVAVITFPGSGGDTDMLHALKDAPGVQAQRVRHTATSLDEFDAIVLPGGFSYGDYLRCGAMAALADCIPAIKQAALAGVPVLGVGNGFQILTEAGLLPGALTHNQNRRFLCASAALTVECAQTMFTKNYTQGETIHLPIAHGQGRYYADDATLAELKAAGRIVFTYRDNQSGSAEGIAGIVNAAGNVLGMMPHPERAVESLLGSEDGLRLFQSILQTWRDKL